MIPFYQSSYLSIRRAEAEALCSQRLRAQRESNSLLLQEARGERRAERRELHALRRASRQAAAAPSAASVHGFGWELGGSLGVLGYGGACGDSVTPCGALPSTASTPVTRQARAAPLTASSEEEWSLSEDGASTE